MTDTTDAPKPIIWAGGEHPMTLQNSWVRNVLTYRGLPGDYGSTPAACFKRFDENVFSIDDVEKVIELGLIGGGMSEDEAIALVDKHVRCKPVLENSATAFSVLATLFVTPSDTAPESEVADNG